MKGNLRLKNHQEWWLNNPLRFPAVTLGQSLKMGSGNQSVVYNIAKLEYDGAKTSKE